MHDLYCELYLKSSRVRRELAKDIASCIGGVAIERFGYSVETALAVFEIEENKDHIRPIPESSPDAFLTWKIRVEVEARPGVERAAYVQQISTLVSWFRKQGEAVVAACDFEDELPQG